VKNRIKQFLKKKPGKRFLFLHRISHAYFKNKSGFYVFSVILFSVLLILIGIVLLILPGPGLLFIAIGITPLMYLSKNFAKKIDNLEIFLYALFKKKK
jgi:hypothetical protein